MTDEKRPSLLTQHFTDVGNAERLYAVAPFYRYCVERKLLLRWTGKRWEPDQEMIHVAAKRMVEKLFDEINALPDKTEEEQARIKNLLKQAFKCESLAKRNAMITDFQHDSRIRTSVSRFD